MLWFNGCSPAKQWDTLIRNEKTAFEGLPAESLATPTPAAKIASPTPAPTAVTTSAKIAVQTPALSDVPTPAPAVTPAGETGSYAGEGFEIP